MSNNNNNNYEEELNETVNASGAKNLANAINSESANESQGLVNNTINANKNNNGNKNNGNKNNGNKNNGNNGNKNTKKNNNYPALNNLTKKNNNKNKNPNANANTNLKLANATVNESLTNKPEEGEEGEEPKEGEEPEEGEEMEEKEDEEKEDEEKEDEEKEEEPLNTSASNEITTVESQVEANNTNKANTAERISLNRLCMNLLNHQIVMKLYHFQTEEYGAHKASDSYLEKYANTLDKFLEVAQGIYGKITLKKYSLSGSSHNDENIFKHINGMITYWREKIDDVLDNYTDLINIRDELVGDAEQLKYLLSFK